MEEQEYPAIFEFTDMELNLDSIAVALAGQAETVFGMSVTPTECVVLVEHVLRGEKKIWPIFQADIVTEDEVVQALSEHFISWLARRPNGQHVYSTPAGGEFTRSIKEAVFDGCDRLGPFEGR